MKGKAKTPHPGVEAAKRSGDTEQLREFQRLSVLARKRNKQRVLALAKKTKEEERGPPLKANPALRLDAWRHEQRLLKDIPDDDR